MQAPKYQEQRTFRAPAGKHVRSIACSTVGWKYYYEIWEWGRAVMERPLFIWCRSGSYANYMEAVQSAGGHVRVSEHPADAVGCGGLLLPGGGDLEPWRYGQENLASRSLEPERDQAELELLDWFLAERKPVLGICRGMQTINVFFGGTLIQDLPGHSAVSEIDRLHAVRTAPSVLWALYVEQVIVNSAHHQAVGRLGAGLEAVQWAPDGIVEALVHRSLPVWAVQWHPERLRSTRHKAGAADGDRIFRSFLETCRFS